VFAGFEDAVEFGEDAVHRFVVVVSHDLVVVLWFLSGVELSDAAVVVGVVDMG